MNLLLTLTILAVVGGDAEPRRMIVSTDGRVRLTGEADDATLRQVPAESRVLFMLSAGKLTPAGLQHLGRLEKLEFLRLNRSQHVDAALAALAGHRRLTHLKLWSDAGLTTAGARHLRSVASLKSLDLAGVPLDPEILSELPPQLETLSLEGCGVGDSGLAALPTLPRLKYLSVRRDPQVSEAGLIEFISRHPALERLAVDEASDRLLAALARLPSLSSLWLSGKPPTVSGVRRLGQLSRLERLTISAALEDQVRAELQRLPNPHLDKVVHRGRYIPLESRRRTVRRTAGSSTPIPPRPCPPATNR